MNWQDYINGVETSFHYDGRGMIDWLHHHRVSPYQNLAWREYTRDERDRIISWQAGGDNSVNPMQDGRGHRFAYDAEGQLTDAWYGPYDPANSTDGTAREDHFNYDALGNRRGSNWQGWDGTINYLRKDTKLNQYRSWQPYSPVINYDDDFGPPWGAPAAANGVVMQDGYITASYNALNQPIAIWAPAFGSNYLWYGYDPLGRCVKRWVGPGDGSAPGGFRFFYYDGWNLIEDGSSPWNPEHAYVNGARVDEIVASYTWGEPSYHHYDANGNCMTLTNAAGNITEQYYYDAFGKPYVFDGAATYYGDWSPSGNRFLFTGREYINELKLYDYRNRLYNPQMGRFLQPDPKEFAAGDYNLYRYCHNDPVNKNDPFGLLEVYYWPSSWIPFVPGHISMRLDDGTYISAWPKEPGSVGKIRPPDYAKDVKEAGQHERLKIEGLDEKRIKDWWQQREKEGDWSLLDRNCSDAVTKGLREGGLPVGGSAPYLPKGTYEKIKEAVDKKEKDKKEQLPKEENKKQR